jgi:hypothetical protein
LCVTLMKWTKVFISMTYLGYFIGITTASFSKRFAFSSPLMLSHLTSGLPRMMSLYKIKQNAWSKHSEYWSQNVKSWTPRQYKHNMHQLSNATLATESITCINSRPMHVFQQNQKQEAKTSFWKWKTKNQWILEAKGS